MGSGFASCSKATPKFTLMFGFMFRFKLAASSSGSGNIADVAEKQPNMNVNVTVTRFWFRFRIHGDDVEHVPKFEFELKRECGTKHELLAGSDSGSLYTISLSLSLLSLIHISEPTRPY